MDGLYLLNDLWHFDSTSDGGRGRGTAVWRRVAQTQSGGAQPSTDQGWALGTQLEWPQPAMNSRAWRGPRNNSANAQQLWLMVSTAVTSPSAHSGTTSEVVMDEGHRRRLGKEKPTALGAESGVVRGVPDQLAINQIDELWVFCLADERWEQIDTGAARLLPPPPPPPLGEGGHGSAAGSSDWPGARYGALVDSGWMMAGVGTHECVTTQFGGAKPGPATGLSGLWRWSVTEHVASSSDAHANQA
jgi:hypothetical protein